MGISEGDGSYVTAESAGRMTPKDGLLYEAMNGNTDKVKKLLEQHADVNKQGKDGWTALMWAADRGHLDVVKLLVERGADLTIKDNYGETAAMHAKRRGYNAVAAYLDSIMQMRNEITNSIKSESGSQNQLNTEFSNVLRRK